MNKIILSSVLACGLLLLHAPEAVAHEARHSEHLTTTYNTHGRDSFRRDRYRDSCRHDFRSDYQDSRYERAHKMPRWLKRNRSFRHWFKHTRLRKNRHLSWHELFDIYRWQYAGY